MQGPMFKALRRFTQLLRVHIYIPGCCKYIRMANGLQPLADLCMDGCCADKAGICCTKSDVRKWALRRSAFYQCVADINDLFGSCRFRIEKRLSRSHPDFPSGNLNRGEVKPR